MKQVTFTQQASGRWVVTANFAMEDAALVALTSGTGPTDPLEMVRDAHRYHTVRSMDAGELERIAHQAESAEDFDRQVDEHRGAE